MNMNQAMTVGAIGFAGFALWKITRKPGGAVTAQPAQQARDTGLTAWNDLLNAQSMETNLSPYYSAAQLDAMFKP